MDRNPRNPSDPDMATLMARLAQIRAEEEGRDHEGSRGDKLLKWTALIFVLTLALAMLGPCLGPDKVGG